MFYTNKKKLNHITGILMTQLSPSHWLVKVQLTQQLK